MQQVTAYGTTRTGLVRRSNEDHILLERSILNQGRESLSLSVGTGDPVRPGVLLAVADGIGGEAGGAVASRLALETLRSRYYGAGLQESREAVIRVLHSSAAAANDAVLEAAESEPRLARMGCTLTGVCLLADGFVVFNAGDSRVYRFRQGVLECLTRDDSMASLVVEAGAMTAEEAARSPIGHTLTNCLGSHEFRLNVQEQTWRDGDLLLACSDGLYDMVSDERIQAILSRPASLGDRTESLVEEALANGGSDNISIVVVTGA